METFKKKANIAFSFDPGTPKPRLKGQLDARLLREAGRFLLVFPDGKGINVAGLLEVDNYNLLVKDDNGKRLLIPKHSIRYIVLP